MTYGQEWREEVAGIHPGEGRGLTADEAKELNALDDALNGHHWEGVAESNVSDEDMKDAIAGTIATIRTHLNVLAFEGVDREGLARTIANLNAAAMHTHDYQGS